MVYAQIRNKVVENFAVFSDENPPKNDFAGFDLHISIPADLPVTVGCTWDGECFRDLAGAVVHPLETRQYSKSPILDMYAALTLLGVAPEEEDPQ